MFKCDVTGKMSLPGEKCNKIVAEVRERVYLDDEGNVVGRGYEIVKELKATDEGVAMWKRLTLQG
jgi:hypothetical protein